jgi:hypothetical protein
VEGIAADPSVELRIGQRPDDLSELDDRTGPAVGHHQRERVLVRGPDVDEVDVEAIDLGSELRKLVKPRLRSSPVVLVLPVGAQLPHIVQRNPLRPVVHGLAFRPARLREAAAQVIEISLRNLDLKRDDVLAHSPHPFFGIAGFDSSR